MTDIHCHILPAVDDGSESLDESVRMLMMAAQSGSSAIIATPHCNLPDVYQNYWDDELSEKIALLQNVAKDRGIQIDLYPGQEVFYTPQAISLLREQKIITLNHSRYLLVEFDFNERAETILHAVRRISLHGYVPIIAHPERYKCVTNYSLIKSLKGAGALLQINKDSLIGTFGHDPQSVGLAMLDRRLADFVASDAHGPYVRCPDLEEIHEYISEEFSWDYAEYLLESNPECVVKDKEIYMYER